MQIQTEEMRRAMGETDGFVPRRCDAPGRCVSLGANPKEMHIPRAEGEPRSGGYRGASCRVGVTHRDGASPWAR